MLLSVQFSHMMWLHARAEAFADRLHLGPVLNSEAVFINMFVVVSALS